MGEFDAATWQALGVTLTGVGLLLSVLAWRRRGAVSGLRGMAWSLIPLAAAMTGLLRVVWEVTESVSSWAVRLVFSPVVWAGLLVAGTSAALFVVSGFLRRRTPRRSGPAGKSAKTSEQPPAVTGSRPPAATAPAADEDLEDIEAILRKHGIS